MQYLTGNILIFRGVKQNVATALFVLVCVVRPSFALAQSANTDSLAGFVRQIVNGDTIYMADLAPVYIYPIADNTEVSKKEIQKYNRLVRNVKKAYPYAKLANAKLKEIDRELAHYTSKKEQRAFLDVKEKELRSQFENELKQLTVSQGRILIKLIDRETGNSTYVLVKELRGSLSAFFWQSFARLFGTNLKTKYDPLGEDKDIEDIIQKIELGKI